MPGSDSLFLQRVWQQPWQHRGRSLTVMSRTGQPLASESDLLDVAAAARYLGVNEVFVRRLVLERRLRYYKLGKFVRFRTADLDDFIERGRVEPTIRRAR